MSQKTVAEDQSTPIFDALAAEVGLDWAGCFDQTADADAAREG